MADFTEISPTTVADLLDRGQVMDIGIRPLWAPVPRLTGPAFTVRCPDGDQVSLHAAIHRAPAGSVIVAESGALNGALAGGNVCAVAQRNGIAGFVIDGVIRDVTEVREIGFPVFARGVFPKPGIKKQALPFNEPVTVGGVLVNAGDIIVADEEGVVVVPAASADEVREKAAAKQAKEAAMTLDEWADDHRTRIGKILDEQGFTG
ncbi:RraA family protein [Pseudonocardiaceae bacterium YIM PH 21723]|nr:RraA family protein [Pseudonocardiaceae bacterium YIM PH 21723]